MRIKHNKLSIGNVKLENNIIVAPMAGFTNWAFREIAYSFGAGLACTEMVSANALIRNNSTTDIIKTTKPLSVQVFAPDNETLVLAAKKVESQADIVDINLGCPVNKVIKNNAGAKLLEDPNKVFDCVNAVRKQIKKPLTVKMRSGFKDESLAIENALAAQSAGADAICMHPRTREALYSGFANWQLLAKVKQCLKIPIIGNGDVRDASDALRMLNETDVDGVMIGRGLIGNPWLIAEILCLLKGDKFHEHTRQQKHNLVLKHLKLSMLNKDEVKAIYEFRKIALLYAKHITGIDAKRILQAITFKEMEQVFTDV